MANEQEAAAGLYSLLKANPDDGPQARPDPPRSSPSAGGGATPNDKDAEEGKMDIDHSIEGMRKLTEMLLQNRPVVDPLKNQGFGIVTPHQHDILSGRGNGANQHPGNIFFRNLIHKYKHHYIHTGPSEKKLITKRIVEEVQERNPPGRFLKQNPETELWDCLDIDKVLKKTGQALREKAPELKRRAREEHKMKITTSQESYFQNSRLNRHESSKSISAADFESMSSMRFDNVLSMSSANDSMTFPIQPGTLDAIAYQTIPLADPSRNDAFNMSNLAAVANQVDPVNRKKTEQLIAIAADSESSLADVFKFAKENPSSLCVNKNKVVQKRYSLPVRRSSSKVQKIKQEEFILNAVSPHAHDVLFHEGMIVPSHSGSQFFCKEVNKLLPQYKGPVVNENRIEQKIIAAIGQRWPPGRFLCAANNTSNTTWHVLSFTQALQAVTNHMRLQIYEAQRVQVPSPNDVLVVRGNSQHQGNILFRNLIEKHCPKYEHNPLQHSKKQIAKMIVNEIEKTGGRFLKFNSQHNFWEPLGQETAMLKTLQGLRDHGKKKEVQQKATKPVGVIVPLLNCVKESVEDSGVKNNDPPGVFFNYYSEAQNINNNTLAIASAGNDPPGQVAQVANSSEVDTDGAIPRAVQKPDSPGGQNSLTARYHTTPRMVSVPGEIGTSGPVQMTFYQASSSPNVVRENSDATLTKKRPYDADGVGPDLRPTEKRVKLLEP